MAYDTPQREQTATSVVAQDMPLWFQRSWGPRRDWGIQDGDSFVVSGSLPQLGNWQQDQPLLLSETQQPFWEAEVHTHWDLRSVKSQST